MELYQQWIGGTLMIIGAVFSVIGGLGLLRLPDLFSRLHAGGVTDTAGAGFILVGLGVYAGVSLGSVKLLMILFFLLITTPSSSHALAHSALAQGRKPLLANNNSAGSKDKPA